MTAYNAIADSDVDPESPGTTTLFTRVRDNPLAMFEGSSGAPKIQTPAYDTDSVLMSAAVDKAVASTGTQSIGIGASWVIPVGFYNMTSIAAVNIIQFQIYVSSTWSGALQPAGLVWSDGANMRLYNNSGVSSINVFWQKMG